MNLKSLVRVVALSAVFASSFAFADEEVVDTGGTGMRRPGYLLDRSEHSERSMMLDVHLLVPYGYLGYVGYGFPVGVGATFYLPLVKDGFIAPVNDEFGIDFGIDSAFFLGGYSFAASFWVPVAAQWKFHITDSFEAFAKLGLALRVWPGYTLPVYFDVYGSVGINWMFSKAIGLRAEVGYPGLKVGVVFAF